MTDKVVQGSRDLEKDAFLLELFRSEPKITNAEVEKTVKKKYGSTVGGTKLSAWRRAAAAGWTTVHKELTFGKIVEMLAAKQKPTKKPVKTKQAAKVEKMSGMMPVAVAKGIRVWMDANAVSAVRFEKNGSPTLHMEYDVKKTVQADLKA